MTFENLNIIPPILDALKALGYSEPTPIQEQAIPLLLEGRDLLGCAQTGTGKTCAFTVPILQLMNSRMDLKAKAKKIKALIITPTRELAIQIDESIRDYGQNLPGLRHTVIFGGVKQGKQTLELQQGIDILTATPGRLLDLIQQGFVHLNDIEFFVLDEADRMLDLGFIHDVRKIIAKLPPRRQSLYFSATLPQEIIDLSTKILNDPAKVTVKPQVTTAERVEQGLYFVDKGNKNALLLHLLKDKDITRALVFARTKHGANKIAKVVNGAGIGAEAIHGNKSQGARVAALEGFKAGRLRILVATDIAARGIDIDELSHVIQYDLPNIPETYVHRIGRTGRAGASGIALAFCDAEERTYLRDIERLIRRPLNVVQAHPFPPGTPPLKLSFAEAAEAEVEAARGGRGGGKGNARSRGGPQNPPSNQQMRPKEQPQAQKPAGQNRPSAANDASREGQSSHNRRRQRHRGKGGSSSNPQSGGNVASPRKTSPDDIQPKGKHEEGPDRFRGGIQWE
jgi:ATP-dependent RNA helicase RhlE